MGSGINQQHHIIVALTESCLDPEKVNITVDKYGQDDRGMSEDSSKA